MENHQKPWKTPKTSKIHERTTENYGKPPQTMENHQQPVKTMENYQKPVKTMKKLVEPPNTTKHDQKWTKHDQTAPEMHRQSTPPDNVWQTCTTHDQRTPDMHLTGIIRHDQTPPNRCHRQTCTIRPYTSIHHHQCTAGGWGGVVKLGKCGYQKLGNHWSLEEKYQ